MLRVLPLQVKPVPSVILELGVSKKDSQLEVEAVLDISYPEVRARLEPDISRPVIVSAKEVEAMDREPVTSVAREILPWVIC